VPNIYIQNARLRRNLISPSNQAVSHDFSRTHKKTDKQQNGKQHVEMGSERNYVSQWEGILRAQSPLNISMKRIEA
jgi:hypothetical protein